MHEELKAEFEKKKASLMAIYKDQYEQRVRTAEIKRHLQLESIKMQFEALNKQSLLDFQEEKEEVFEACRKEIHSKMEAVKEWYRLSKIIGSNAAASDGLCGRTICTRSMTSKERSFHKFEFPDKLACHYPKKKPKLTSKPFIVYMLRDEEILDDLTTIYSSMPHENDK